MSRPTPTDSDALQQFLQAQTTQATIINYLVTENKNKEAMIKNLTTQLQALQKEKETKETNKATTTTSTNKK